MSGDDAQIIKRPTKNDVLCGRGNGVNCHKGNIQFRQIVEQHKVAYVAAPKYQKPAFSTTILEQVAALSPPGRFLKQDPITKLWTEVDEKKTLIKIRQALREGAPKLQQKHDRASPRTGLFRKSKQDSHYDPENYEKKQQGSRRKNRFRRSGGMARRGTILHASDASDENLDCAASECQACSSVRAREEADEVADSMPSKQRRKGHNPPNRSHSRCTNTTATASTTSSFCNEFDRKSVIFDVARNDDNDQTILTSLSTEVIAKAEESTALEKTGFDRRSAFCNEPRNLCGLTSGEDIILPERAESSHFDRRSTFSDKSRRCNSYDVPPAGYNCKGRANTEERASKRAEAYFDHRPVGYDVRRQQYGYEAQAGFRRTHRSRSRAIASQKASTHFDRKPTAYGPPSRHDIFDVPAKLKVKTVENKGSDLSNSNIRLSPLVPNPKFRTSFPGLNAFSDDEMHGSKDHGGEGEGFGFGEDALEASLHDLDPIPLNEVFFSDMGPDADQLLLTLDNSISEAETYWGKND